LTKWLFQSLLKKIQKGLPVEIIGKDLLAGISSARNMTVGVLKLDAKRPCHGDSLGSFLTHFQE
jgi:hypothetical protein